MTNPHEKARFTLKLLIEKKLDPTPENYTQLYGEHYRSDLLADTCLALSGLFLEHPEISKVVKNLEYLNNQHQTESFRKLLVEIESKKTEWLAELTELRKNFRTGLAEVEDNQEQLSQIASSAKLALNQVNPKSLTSLQAYFQESSQSLEQIAAAAESLRMKVSALEKKLENLEQGTPGGDSVADVDPLTQLLNRRGFQHRIKIDNRPGVLLAVDIDYFKQLNDRYGHPAGDSVLKTISALLTEGTRPFDIVGRFGGEEFIIFLPDIDLAGGARIAERLRRKISLNQFKVSSNEFVHLTASFGLVYWDRKTSFEEVYAESDRMLYAAKGNGRNCVVIKSVALVD